MYKKARCKIFKNIYLAVTAFNPLNQLAFVHVLLENTKFDCDPIKPHHAAHLETCGRGQCGAHTAPHVLPFRPSRGRRALTVDLTTGTCGERAQRVRRTRAHVPSRAGRGRARERSSCRSEALRLKTDGSCTCGVFHVLVLEHGCPQSPKLQNATPWRGTAACGWPSQLPVGASASSEGRHGPWHLSGVV